MVNRGRLAKHRCAPGLMSKRDWQVSALLVLLCGGILVLFTDVELRLVRWVNCGVLAPSSERNSDICR